MLSHLLSSLTRDHLNQATLLSQAVHWPHRQEDWVMLIEMSQGVVTLRDAAVVGTTLHTDYGQEVLMMHMIIVGQSERGQGLGRRLMEAAMEGIADREMRLVAMKDGLPLYEKFGFQPTGEITKCQGNVNIADPSGTEMFSADAQDIDEIILLDRQYFASDRCVLLRWLAQNGRLAITRANGGRITGYAALRRFGRGQVIGPIQAPSAAQAQD